MKNKRLGKGLEALIPQISGEEADAPDRNLTDIEVSRVEANPYQPRMDFDPKHLDELKRSIEANGVIQPITVRKRGNHFELIAGERRLRAVKDLGYEKIPAFLMEVASEDQMLELALVENIQREDLNPIDLARAYRRLQKEYGLTQEALARKVGKDRATVTNSIRLLKLPEDVQNSLRKEEITVGHAKALMGLDSPSEQLRFWRKSVKQGWNVRKLEQVVRERSEGKRPVSRVKKTTASPYIEEMEERLRNALVTRVTLRESGKGGRIEIAYYSDDDLDRLVDLICRSAET